MNTRLLVGLLVIAVAGCRPYTLVNPGPTAVAEQSMIVQPQSAWNRMSSTSTRNKWEEAWTKNGPLLDTVAFVGGLPDGESLVKQEEKADRQVPKFQANMGPDELVSMIESSYRIGGVSVFDIVDVEPGSFLDQPSIRMDYTYVAGDGLPRKGRCVMTVSGGQLYLMKLEGAASHYFDAAAPEFDSMLASASKSQ